jgi:AraC family transcriptional regulator
VIEVPFSLADDIFGVWRMPTDPHAHASRRYPRAELIATSAGRSWRGIAAELRTHLAGELPAHTAEHLELTLAVAGDALARVSRKGRGVRQETVARDGTMWIGPAGVGEDSIHISSQLSQILHIYLPSDWFTELACIYGDSRIRVDAVRYIADVEDVLMRELARTIHGELVAQSAGGRLLVESSALALTARLAHDYGSDFVDRGRRDREPACHDRIARAIEYIHDNLDRDLSIAELAGVACLSSFHFARMFKEVTGSSPHRYVSVQRLDRAKRRLLDTRRTLADISLDAGFSSQATFTRRFKAVTGTTPGEFRRTLTQVRQSVPQHPVSPDASSNRDIGAKSEC